MYEKSNTFILGILPWGLKTSTYAALQKIQKQWPQISEFRLNDNLQKYIIRGMAATTEIYYLLHHALV
jgi:hypothetical protein